MFWKYNFGSSAQIETLLQKEDVTLSELMDEEELLQECKAQNKKLIDFLTRAEVLDELVCLVVNEPSMDGELQMRFKYANLAAELLTADVPAIIDKLVASTNLLDVLYKFLKKEKPLNPLLASFFSKVLGMLVQRRSEQNWYSYQFTCFQVLDFLKSRGDFVELAVQHVGTSAIMDLILRLICNVEEDEIRQNVHQWLNECQLVERLVERLSPEADPDEHSSADNILCEISASCRDVSNDGHPQTNPLLLTLEGEETINKMLDLLLHEERNESSLSHVINILLTLLAARMPQQTPQQQQQGLQPCSSIESSDSDSSDGRRNVVARTVAKRLPSLHNILLHPPKKGLLLTAYGQEVEPLGSTRLQVVTLVAALVAANDPIVHHALYELNTVEHLLDLFFKFMLNNFLHTQVEQCLTAILTKAPFASSPQGESDHLLLTQLFTKCHVIERVIAAYEETSEPHDSKQIHNIKGYMGHLRQLANTIVQQAEFGPNEQRIKRLIQELPGDKATRWDDFVSNALAEVNRKNEITPLPGFKEMDMDVIGDFRYADDDFKDPDDNLSGPLQRLSTQGLAVSGTKGMGSGTPTGDQVVEGGGEGGVAEDHDLFEEMCSHRCQGISEFDEMWTDKEKEITFSQESVQSENDKEKEQGSSSEEEEEEELSGLRAGETKMEVDQDGATRNGAEKGMQDHPRSLLHHLSRGAKHTGPLISHQPSPGPHPTIREETTAPSSSASPATRDSLSPNCGSAPQPHQTHPSSYRPLQEQPHSNHYWAEVFDKRCGVGKSCNRNEPINPWQSAPMADTSDNSGWADFGSNAFGSAPSLDAFGQTRKVEKETFSADFTSVFGTAVAQQDSSNSVFGETTSNQEAFKADFSNVNFDSAFETNCDDQKNTVTSAGDPQNSELEAAVCEEESVKEKNEDHLIDNFNFLSSRGLLKNSDESSGSSEAGMADPILSKSEALSGDQSLQDGETVAETQTQS